MPIAVLLIAALVAGAGFMNLNASLGAHPLWAFQTAWIGAFAGAGAAMILHRRHERLVIWVGLAILVAASLAAYLGKLAFVRSFAENGMAGRFWYFGWFGIAAGLVMVLAPILARRGR